MGNGYDVYISYTNLSTLTKSIWRKHYSFPVSDSIVEKDFYEYCIKYKINGMIDKIS